MRSLPDVSLLELSFGAADRGFPLPDRLRWPMEQLFGTSFEAVRVHVGPQAAALGVLAINHGSDVYFAPGAFDPDSPDGLRLIAHELTHVRQQQQGRVPILALEATETFAWRAWKARGSRTYFGARSSKIDRISSFVVAPARLSRTERSFKNLAIEASVRRCV